MGLFGMRANLEILADGMPQGLVFFAGVCFIPTPVVVLVLCSWLQIQNNYYYWQ